MRKFTIMEESQEESVEKTEEEKDMESHIKSMFSQYFKIQKDKYAKQLQNTSDPFDFTTDNKTTT